MKKLVKPLFFTVTAIALSLLSFSQIKVPSLNGLSADMKKVIREYPHQFEDIKGEVIEENPQATDYACTFQVSGAEQSSITKYSSRNHNVFSWQALMLTTEDFEEASKKYHALFRQLNNMAVKMDYGVTFYLKGKYQAPTEEKRFHSTMMAFEKADQITHKMKLEISMTYELLEWKVKVLIYEREREDTDEGEELDW